MRDAGNHMTAESYADDHDPKFDEYEVIHASVELATRVANRYKALLYLSLNGTLSEEDQDEFDQLWDIINELNEIG